VPNVLREGEEATWWRRVSRVSKVTRASMVSRDSMDSMCGGVECLWRGPGSDLGGSMGSVEVVGFVEWVTRWITRTDMVRMISRISRVSKVSRVTSIIRVTETHYPGGFQHEHRWDKMQLTFRP
jgi:hypothetical protein